ncbi:MAG TPA: ATP-binding protein [Acidobacteriota bacterium]|nr:ATP-binding protein [Acidobacteriota bacterium]
MNKRTRDFVIKNDLSEIDVLADGIMKFCLENNVEEEAGMDIRLAVEEVVSNTIKYGYEDAGIHFIRLHVTRDTQEVLLEIEDDGEAFNPLEASKPDLTLPAENRPKGGLGIYLMNSVMDRVEYERVNTKNILRMRKLTGKKEPG